MHVERSNSGHIQYVYTLSLPKDLQCNKYYPTTLTSIILNHWRCQSVCLPFVSLISSSRFFMYAKSLTMDSDRSSSRLSSTSRGFSFSTLAIWGGKVDLGCELPHGLIPTGMMVGAEACTHNLETVCTNPAVFLNIRKFKTAGYILDYFSPVIIDKLVQVTHLKLADTYLYYAAPQSSTIWDNKYISYVVKESRYRLNNWIGMQYVLYIWTSPCNSTYWKRI